MLSKLRKVSKGSIREIVSNLPTISSSFEDRSNPQTFNDPNSIILATIAQPIIAAHPSSCTKRDCLKDGGAKLLQSAVHRSGISQLLI